MKGETWRMTHRITNNFIKNIHNKELPEWMDHRIKENSDLIINWFRSRSSKESDRERADLTGWFRNEEERNKECKIN